MRNSRRNLRLMFALAVGSALLFYFGREHWGHIFGVLPYALFLVCPLMHMFMRHGHHGSHDTGPPGDIHPTRAD